MYEEKDWIMKQVRQIAEMLGAMLSKESIKEILKFDQSDTQNISDEDIEIIIAIVDVLNKQNRLNLTEAALAQRLGIDELNWSEISIKNRMPNNREYHLMMKFLEK